MDKPASTPAFKKCAGCGYSLKGLPANHFCPECGLRFDERCALYPVRNPRTVVALWLLMFAGGWTTLRYLPDLANLGSASLMDKIGALAGLFWVTLVAAGVWVITKRYRRGFEVAVVTDGLILRLTGFGGELIPWSDIGRASIKHRPAKKSQVAVVHLKTKKTMVEIGGVINVFPDRADVEYFVAEVNRRTVANTGSDNPIATSNAHKV